MKRLYLVRVVPPARPVESPPKVVSLAARRKARLERLDPPPPPPKAAA
jgi:hypothetical protein